MYVIVPSVRCMLSVYHRVRLRLVRTAAVRHVRLSLVGQSSRLDDGSLLHPLYAVSGSGRPLNDSRHSTRGQFDRRCVLLSL